MTIPKFTRIICLLCVTAMLITVLAGCAGASSGAVHDSGDQATPAPKRPGDTEEPVLWAEQMNARETEDVSRTMDIDTFDERFLEYLSRTRKGNYMASPLSFRYALGLLLTGAGGETKAQLLSALGVSSEEEWISHCLDFNGFVGYFASELERDVAEFEEAVSQGWVPAGTAAPFRALRVANSVWKAERIPER